MASFLKATKKNSRLRLALNGPTGAGKTYTGLSIATGLLSGGTGNGRIAVIDTERGSASKYSDIFDFDVQEFGTFDPRQLVESIQDAERAGYSVILIDSLTHFWNGKGGILEIVDKEAIKSKSGNTFAAWAKATPIQNAMYEAILGSSCHVIATMRSKMEYSMEADPRTGKLTPRKIGMAPVQRDGIIYEFDIEGDLDVEHNLIVGKTRWSKIDGEVYPKAGVEFGRKLVSWLGDGVIGRDAMVVGGAVTPNSPIQAKPVDYSATPIGLVTPEMVVELKALAAKLGMNTYEARSALASRGASKFDQLSLMDATAWLHELRSKASVAEFADRIGQPGDAGPVPPVTVEVSAEASRMMENPAASVEIPPADGTHSASNEAQPQREDKAVLPHSPGEDYQIADQPTRERSAASEKRRAKANQAGGPAGAGSQPASDVVAQDVAAVA